MGLDMYVYTTEEKFETEVDFKCDGDNELYYWRKHPNLHGWMEKLYRAKGGSEDSFNCVNLALTLKDIYALEYAVRKKKLPETQGFFFGQSYDTDRPRDLEFIAKAHDAIQEGETVFYFSSW